MAYLNLTDEIRNYKVTTALPSELAKLYEEYHALAVLKYCSPQQFSKLHKAESPDLQDEENSLGVEVTVAISPQDQQISGESLKYSNAKTDAERERSLQIIRKNGGDRNKLCTSYPVGTASKDKKNVKNAYARKLKKLNAYRQKCSRVGLVIKMDIPLFLFNDPKWGEWLPRESEDEYDFVVLLHWSGLDIYENETKEYSRFRIGSDDMDALGRLGRMAAEGRIKDDDPVWR